MSSAKKIKSLLLVVFVVSVFFCYNYFSTPNNDKYVGYYESVHGLQKSAPVYYYGVLIGRVEEVSIEKNGKVHVLFSIHKNTKIAEGTIARITSDPLKGGMAVIFKPGIGKPLSPNVELPTMVDSSLTDQFHTKVSPLINKGEHYLSKIDSSLYKVIELTDTNCNKSVQHRILKMKEMIGSLSEKINRSKKQIQKFEDGINNVNSSNYIIIKNSQTISSKIALVDSVTSKNIDLSSIENLHKNFSETKNKATKMRNTEILKSNSVYVKIDKKTDSINKQLTDLKVKKLK